MYLCITITNKEKIKLKRSGDDDYNPRSIAVCNYLHNLKGQVSRIDLQSDG